MAVAFLLLRPSRFKTRPSRSSSVAFRNSTRVNVAVAFLLRPSHFETRPSRFETRPSRFETRMSRFEAFRNATVAFLNATVTFLNATVALTWWSRFFFDRLVSKRNRLVLLLQPSRFETQPSRSSSTVSFRNATVSF